MLVDMHSQLVRIQGNQYDSEEETIQIIKSAAADGITHIIATPLYRTNSFNDSESVIANRVDNLNLKLNQLNIPITVIEGMEIVLYEKLAQDIKLNLLPLADSNKYVFISFQNHEVPSFALNVFFEMQLMGYIPIIANVEQNIDLVNNDQKVGEFVDNGALIHVSAASILGMNGRRTRKKALKLCRKGLVQLISSTSSESKSRPSLLKPAYEYLEKKLSRSSVDYFIRNAESIVNGSDFHIQNPVTFKKK